MSNTYDADHRWQNMCAMLGRLGLDALELAHGRLASDLRSAVTSCQHCRSDQVCSDWLVRAPQILDKALFLGCSIGKPSCSKFVFMAGAAKAQ